MINKEVKTIDKISSIQRRLEKVYSSDSLSVGIKCKVYFETMSLLFEIITDSENLHFSTLFSRIAFIGNKYGLPKADLHHMHLFRKFAENFSSNDQKLDVYQHLGYYCCGILLAKFWGLKLQLWQDSKKISILEFKKEKKHIVHFKKVVEALVFDIDETAKELFFYEESEADTKLVARYDLHDRNEIFTKSLKALHTYQLLPIRINFIDVEITETQVYHPAAFVIHPDHLVDVTAIAETFKATGNEAFIYAVSKFKPYEPSKYVLIGNLVNAMLDQLISDPKIEFSDFVKGMFQLNPIGFSLLSDDGLREVMTDLHLHFNNLKRVVLEDLPKMDIKSAGIYVEPSFFSKTYGIQGRLDVLHQSERGSDIIELKSGKIFKPNVYGINDSHFIQTLLYDLLLKFINHYNRKISIYILYSKENNSPLKFAPAVTQQQYEALHLRNDIILIEMLFRRAKDHDVVLKYIKPENFPDVKGFVRRDIDLFYNVYCTLNPLEKTYFNHVVAFLALEHGLSKTGDQGIHDSNGHASLWLESDDQKMDRFAILKGLKIVENESMAQDPYIIFKRTISVTPLANFRVGDIGILYADDTQGEKAVLAQQIFKCVITEISKDRIGVKLRNKQLNQTIFNTGEQWNIEQDTLDSNFTTMYKSLMTWTAAGDKYRALFLGLKSPEIPANNFDFKRPDGLTDNQFDVLKRAINAQDYFLIWGPPGTGKTSVLLKQIVNAIFNNTEESIMLLAYTNRAVDEICNALMELGSPICDQFIRIGSRVSTDVKFRHRLLDDLTGKCTTRQEIIELLESCKIYVSTVSGMMSKPDIFSLKKFDTVVIDEASQILEPMVCGILTYFRKWILIGDHKQLPAIVTQRVKESEVADKNLFDLGITNLRNSLFDRLFQQAMMCQRSESVGILHEQGRMHPELMDFVNTHFYEGVLTPLDGVERFKQPFFFQEYSDQLAWLRNNRKLFFSNEEIEDINWKTNSAEADATVLFIQRLIELYEMNHMPIHEKSIGVITPYRAQIAMIKYKMESILPQDIVDKITVDTVERYQGGARDIIIISFCINRISQLDNLIVNDVNGIDRKLNVALTRAKEHIILIGNQALLEETPLYKEVLNGYYKFDLLSING